MRNLMRPLTLALAGLLCLAPLAVAQTATTGTLSGNGAADLDKVSGAYDYASETGGHHAAAEAATDEATGSLGADLTHSEIGDEGFWAWLSLRLDVLVQQLADLLGQDLSTDAGADVKLGGEGLADVGATVGDVKVDGAASASAPEVEGKADEATAKLHETKGTVEGMVPHLG